MEEKQMLYINVMICDSDSNRIIDLENKLEEIGSAQGCKDERMIEIMNYIQANYIDMNWNCRQ